MRKWIVPFLLLAATATMAGCGKAKAPSDPLPNVSDDLLPGKKVFQQTCASCHGANGRGGYGADLTHSQLVSKETAESLHQFLAKNHVPSLPDTQGLSDQQLQDAAKFIKVLSQ